MPEGTNHRSDTSGFWSIRWIFRMAWRDSRQRISRLLLYVSSMVLGVGALVAITSFGRDMLRAVDGQARELVGADMRFESSSPFDAETEALFDSLAAEQARITSFASMVWFPDAEVSRLSRIRALDGEFPFYGELETNPPGARDALRNGSDALVDEALLLQTGAAVGDSVYVGRQRYRIGGVLLQVPGESAAGAMFGPRVFVPATRIDTTLLGRGSRVEYQEYIRLPAGAEAEEIRESLREFLRARDIGVDTVREVRSDWGGALGDLYSYMNLVAFIALLLGGLGVASAIQVHTRRKIDSVAILRCIGASSRQTFAIFVVQAAAMGLAGALFGVALGIGIQQLMPVVLGDFLPVSVDVRISIAAILEGLVVGLSVSIVFALIPLVKTRRVPPLRVLRASVESETGGADRLRLILIAVVVIGVIVFAIRQTGDILQSILFAAGIVVVFGLLYGVARLVMLLAKRLFPESWPYVWRQGLANLYRPGNQTATLLVALGLGTFLILTLFLTQEALLGKIESLDREGQPNTILFDIQPDQLAGVESIVDSLVGPQGSTVPVVTMRLSEVKGIAINELVSDSTFEGSRWALRREYRSTYRSEISESERVIDGAFSGVFDGGPGPVPISLEEEIARELDVGIGDELRFDVQGYPVQAIVGSIREVDWQRISTNFFVVFPDGILEEAPQFFVITARSDGPAVRADLQNQIVQHHPNVSIVDLDLIFSTVQEVLDRLSLVIRFMALFSVLTGVLVLISSVLVSRFQRVKEGVLLRTIGASSRQLLTILATEYALLGILSAITGGLLACLAGWAIAWSLFDTSMVFPVVPLLITSAVVTGITVLIGLLNSREIVDRPPLEILRTTAA